MTSLDKSEYAQMKYQECEIKLFNTEQSASIKMMLELGFECAAGVFFFCFVILPYFLQ